VGVFVNTITVEPFEISSQILLREQGVVKSSDEFENSCILMHCGVRVVPNVQRKTELN